MLPTLRPSRTIVTVQDENSRADFSRIRNCANRNHWHGEGNRRSWLAEVATQLADIKKREQSANFATLRESRALWEIDEGFEHDLVEHSTAAHEQQWPAPSAPDLPLNFHPAAFRVSTDVTPFGAG